MKKFLIIFIISLLAAAGYYFYTDYYNKETFDPWQLVPSNSAIVVEAENADAALKQILETDLGAELKKTPAYNDIQLFFNALDSLSAFENGSKILLASSLKLSFVPVAQDQFEILYVLPATDPEIQKVISTINSSLQTSENYNVSVRNYSNQQIKEVKEIGKDISFSFFFYENHLIASKSSFLVESVIRLLDEDGKQDFRSKNSKLFTLPSLTSDVANIYINYPQLSKWLKTFVNPSTTSFFDPLAEVDGGVALDLSISKNNYIFNGFSVSYNNADLFPKHKDQLPGKINSINFIPASSQYVWTHNFSNSNDFAGDISKWIGNELSLIALPSLNEGETSDLLLIEAKDPGEALNYFNVLAERASKEDTVYREYYAGYPLTEIIPLEWPQKSLSRYTPGSQNFFTIVNNFIAVSNNLETLKILIEDIENENTWGKNLDLRKYIQLGLEEVNMSLIVHPENYWRSLLYNANDHWQENFQEYSKFFKGFVISAFQINRLEDKYYTSVLFGYEPQENLAQGNRSLDTRFSESFDQPLYSQPFVLKSHVSTQFEVLVQDEEKNLILMDWDGNKLWQDSIPSYINTDVHQIDYYKNEKLQYFFTGENKVFVVDRNGNDVEDYPISVGERDIEFSQVIDYDNSKNYRFLLADDQGSVYLIDKHGKILDGWDPKKLQGALSQAPFHTRIRGKDYIVVIQERGLVHLLNRRGEHYDNFPIDLEERITGKTFLQKGTDAKGSELHLVTENGRLIKINLEGRVVSKENLYRPTRESKFYLIPEAQNKTYIIVREGLNRIAVLNEKGERRFEKDYLSLDPLEIQYYYFGSGKEIIGITDQEQQFTYLYNESGDLINNRPINSAEPVAILYFNGTKQFHIFKVYNNTLSSLTF
ncbi:MAG: DUF3352 domain-containing protein [Candidatus Cyclobacteriaceae bacterium M2_1C_046]